MTPPIRSAAASVSRTVARVDPRKNPTMHATWSGFIIVFTLLAELKFKNSDIDHIVVNLLSLLPARTDADISFHFG